MGCKFVGVPQSLVSALGGFGHQTFQHKDTHTDKALCGLQANKLFGMQRTTPSIFNTNP